MTPLIHHMQMYMLPIGYMLLAEPSSSLVNVVQKAKLLAQKPIIKTDKAPSEQVKGKGDAFDLT